MSSIRRKIFNLYNENKLINNLLGPVLNYLPKEFVYGNGFKKELSIIRKEEYQTKEYHLLQTSKKLEKLLRLAYDNCYFYKQDLQKIGIENSSDISVNNALNILEKMSFTDKPIMRNNTGNIFIKSSLVKYDYISTGGTSGQPFYFYINSDRSAKEWAYMVDQWSRIGYTLNSKRVTFRGKKIEGLFEDDLLLKERRFSSFRLNDDYLNEIWNYLLDYKPEFIYSYPSGAYFLAKFVKKNNKNLPKSLKGVLIGSENIINEQRNFIEEIFQVKSYVWYGHSEKAVLAGECEHEKIYHAYPQYGYVEFINEKGEKAKPGEFAEIVGTSFINTVMPFIRYRTGDWCIYLGETCNKCKRNYSVFKDVQGRWTQEILIGKDNSIITMTAINVHSKEFKNVARFQYYQDTVGKAILKIMPLENFTETDRKNIHELIMQKIKFNMDLETIIVNEIPLTGIGKYKYIDQKLDLSKYI